MSNQTNQAEPSWIWKIFGGTILAMVTLLFLALFNTINNNISSSKQESLNLINDIKAEIRENRNSIDSFRDRVSVLENNETKTRMDTLTVAMKNIEEFVNLRTEKVVANETSLAILREDIKPFKEELKVITNEIRTLRERMIENKPLKEIIVE